MSVELNHLMIPARDKHASARFLPDILGGPVAAQWGPFVPVRVGEVTLDYADAGEFAAYHCAFPVSDEVFDPALARIEDGGVGYSADPYEEEPGQVNHLYGGRGMYVRDPAGHRMELLTGPTATPACSPARRAGPSAPAARSPRLLAVAARTTTTDGPPAWDSIHEAPPP